jgi:branched-chain amino acid transport system permease protein
VVLAGLIMATTLDASNATTYSLIFTFSLFALSLVPLIGFAGQISLATLTFGAIGALIYSHHGTDGNPIGLVLAFVVPAFVGALIALPALRLSGIYLALGTAAFAVALDRWIFNLGDFDIGPIHISLFRLGSTEVAPLSLFGYRFDTPSRQMMLVSVAFAIGALLIVAVRRSRYGRRLLAMKSSEAACATLGLDLVGTKLTVFALSAGIAGVAGALYGMQLRSISPQNFDFVHGLPVLLLAVVGGIGAIGGALMAGFSLMGLLPLIATLGVFFANLASVLPGLAGIGLGRNPNGSVHDMREGFAPILRYRPSIIGIVVAIPVLWGLRLADVLGNSLFYVLLAFTPIVAVTIASIRVGSGDGTVDEDTPAVDDVPLEWKGFSVPWEPGDAEALDHALGMNEVEFHGAP